MWNFLETDWVKQSSFVIGILIVWQLAAWLLRNKAYRDATRILQPRTDNSRLIQEGITKFPKENIHIEQVKNLILIIENRKEEKKRAFLDLYRYHFTSSTLLLIFSLISIVLIFIVAQNGLNRSDEFTRTCFYTLASLTSFYALSPLVYKQETNIAKNLSVYLSYDNLQEEVYNYALTNRSFTPTPECISFEEFHSKIIATMAKINTIDFEFNYKAIPVPDFGLKKK